MATTIRVMGDTIKIDKRFVSGKDRIAVNGTVVFEGNAAISNPQRIKVGNREYAVQIETISKFGKVILVHLQIHENGRLVHAGIYNQVGKPVENREQAKSSAGVQMCAFIGATVGVAVMLGLNQATHTVPGGAIGGAIGGGLGAALGSGIGTLVFGTQSSQS
jgi:hypothetical protein